MPSDRLPAWAIEGAVQDRQSVAANWTPVARPLIQGVSVHEVRTVPKSGGYLTEILRAEWLDANRTIDQIFQSVLDGGTISAWHAHARTTDRLFVSHGMARIVLYDARAGSPTLGMLNEFQFGTVRPALLIIPPEVWHGVQALSAPTILMNIVDLAYDYAEPDHWRAPQDSPHIPYRFR